MAATGFASEVPLAVPVGITLVDVSKASYSARDELLWRRLSDAHGGPLFTYTLEGHSGRSSCYGDCTKEFAPFLAPRNAVASGDWSLIDRAEGRQWVYQGQPLYSYAGHDWHQQESETTGYAKRGFTDKADPGGEGFSPKPGWRQAVYDPTQYVRTPADIRLESSEAATGYAFVVAPTGMALYLLASDPKHDQNWTPFYASSLALPVADFSIVRRTDGTRQWAYRGEPLYTYSGDYSETDINGLTQKGARIALAYRFFMPPEFSVSLLPARPPMLTTGTGRAVYTEARYHLQYGGRQTRGGYHFTYADAKAVGTQGCTGACTKIWRPVRADDGAQSSGFWEVMTRSDGSKQWGYKGGALYTYIGDRTPGDTTGNNQSVMVYADSEDRITTVIGEGFSERKEEGNKATDLMSLTGGTVIDPNAYGGAFGAGFYWHLVPLF